MVHSKVVVIPPGARDHVVRYDEAGRRRFRRQFGLAGKFVIMYSGNHSPCHPLDTLLGAAERLRDDPRFAFCFVGGGSQFDRVRRFAGARRLSNMICLPYQPEERLAASLSAADLHAVLMGDPFVGIVHPSKIYNLLVLGIPVLYIGPAESHITDLARAAGGDGWFYAARHGEVERVVRNILAAEDAAETGAAGERELARRFSHEKILSELCGACTGQAGSFPPQRAGSAEQEKSFSALRSSG